MVVAITKMMIMVLLLMAISVKTCPCVLVNRASDTEICSFLLTLCKCVGVAYLQDKMSISARFGEYPSRYNCYYLDRNSVQCRTQAQVEAN